MGRRGGTDWEMGEEGRRVSSADRSRTSSTRSVLLPYALAGHSRELAFAALCCVALGVVLVLEILTPDVVVESFELAPVLVASWLMSNRAAALVGAVAALALSVDFLTESANRPTVILIGTVTLLTALAVRMSAIRLIALMGNQGIAKGVSASLITAPNTGAPLPHLAVALTPRELLVARLAAQAYTAAEIAHELHIGDRTVESHLASTYSKLGIRSKGELIRMASGLGGVHVPEVGHRL
jgi:DNA-binding CsgD family transcriptional regulator